MSINQYKLSNFIKRLMIQVDFLLNGKAVYSINSSNSGETVSKISISGFSYGLVAQ